MTPTRLATLSRTAVNLAALAALSTLAACSSISGALSSDKVDYKSGASSRSVSLEVPPDLTQLNRESRYQSSPAGGPVSASALQAASPAAAQAATVIAAQSAPGDLRIERQGNQRWLVVKMNAEQLWPVVKSFWQEQGFNLALDLPAAGVMETEWSENRAKLPNDAVRNTVGRFLDVLYDTGERDRFRTRLERTAGGTEIYISHRGLAEVYTSGRDNQTVWQTRPSDPQLEAEMLSRLMGRLGATADQAKQVLGSAAPAQPKARLTQPQAAALTVDDDFDTAWRRVGLALDRSGFTVEDRDRSQGLYFVRYADPGKERKSEPGFLSRIFGSSKTENTLVRYRVAVKGNGASTTVTVLDEQGAPASGETPRRIAALLVDDLK